MRSTRTGGGLLVGVLVTVGAIGAGLALVIGLERGRPSQPMVGATLSVAEALATTRTEGFERALTPRHFAFPVDHGPHPTFRTEWWYWTGNLRAPGEGGSSRHFGFQLTLFRSALAPVI